MLTPEQIKELQAKYNITPTNALTKSASTPREGTTGTAADFSFTNAATNYAKEVGAELKNAGTMFNQAVQGKNEQGEDINPISAGIQGGVAATRAAFSPLTAAAKGSVMGVIDAYKTLPDDVKSNIKEVAQDVADFTASTTPGKISNATIDYLKQKAEQYPEAARDILGIVEIASNFVGGKAAKEAGVAIKEGTVVAKEVAETGLKEVAQGVKTAADLAAEATGGAKTTLFGRAKPITSVDDVIKQADEGLMKPGEILSATEKATAKPSLLERWSGVSPDIKNRIAGKQEKLKEYFDVAHARNNFDNLPTPLEYGARNVDGAVTKMESLLNDTGGDIGSFRKKVGSYVAAVDDVKKIENSFSGQLSKLNLEIKNGVVQKIPGKVSRVGSEGDIKILNDLLGELQTVKQSPNLERLIDLRNQFDSRINFAKSARDASGSLDNFSRSVRKDIADVSAKIVGKSEAANLAKYSDFMDALSQLRSFTDRKAGAEFLLKQVLSEKGGTSRAVINLIKERTGIDLMDDAVMASIATDLIGNSRQKGVFRQEITKAGLDAAAAMRGNPAGAIELMFTAGKKALINEEKQFLKAAR